MMKYENEIWNVRNLKLKTSWNNIIEETNICDMTYKEMIFICWNIRKR